jgi:hypothetical protein
MQAIFVKFFETPKPTPSALLTAPQREANPYKICKNNPI